MKSRILIFSLLIAICSSIFIINKEANVEAKACPTGQYYKYNDKDDSFKCKAIGDFKKDTANMSNGTAQDSLNWAQKAGRLAITLSVAVSYATQIVAMTMIVYSAYLYTTSEGDTRRLRQAKMLILYAVTGMAIASFALVISRIIGGTL